MASVAVAKWGHIQLVAERESKPACSCIRDDAPARRAQHVPDRTSSPIAWQRQRVQRCTEPCIALVDWHLNKRREGVYASRDGAVAPTHGLPMHAANSPSAGWLSNRWPGSCHRRRLLCCRRLNSRSWQILGDLRGWGLKCTYRKCRLANLADLLQRARRNLEHQR